jgi:hypothetical protein
VQHPVPQPPKSSFKKKARTAQTVVVPLEPTISSRAPPSFESDGESENDKSDKENKAENDVSGTPSSRSLSPPPTIAQLQKASAGQSRPSNSLNGTAEKRRTGEGTSGSRKRAKVTGTRISLRLRGSDKTEGDEDGWQTVPEEWLDKGDAAKGPEKVAKPADDPFGSDSDLTEVEELEREIEEERRKRESTLGTRKSGRRKGKGAEKSKARVIDQVEESASEQEPVQEDTATGGQAKQLPIRLHMAPLVDPMLPPPLPPGFIEWETVYFFRSQSYLMYMAQLGCIA